MALRSGRLDPAVDRQSLAEWQEFLRMSRQGSLDLTLECVLSLLDVAISHTEPFVENRVVVVVFVFVAVVVVFVVVVIFMRFFSYELLTDSTSSTCRERSPS